MAALVERMRNEPVLWVDDTAYSGLLLAAGHPPWLDAQGLVVWRGKAQRLLRSDVVALDLSALSRAWIASNAGLRQAMVEKKRPIAPLRALLAHEPLRRLVFDALTGLGSNCPRQFLALKLPLPRQWLASSFQAVYGESGTYDVDDIDRAALYIADFVRSFGECAVHALLLEETDVGQAPSIDEFEMYAAVANVAHQFRWDIGYLSNGAHSEPNMTAGTVFDFVVSPDSTEGVWGKLLTLDCQADIGPFDVRPASLIYAVVPEKAQPEAVLTQLDALRITR